MEERIEAIRKREGRIGCKQSKKKRTKIVGKMEGELEPEYISILWLRCSWSDTYRILGYSNIKCRFDVLFFEVL